MSDKRLTQRNRAITLRKIREQLHQLYREDLNELQQALDDALLAAPAAPSEDRLTAPGEWLEERRLTNKKSGGQGKYYVYLRGIGDNGKEWGRLIFHGTLAQYKAARLNNV